MGKTRLGIQRPGMFDTAENILHEELKCRRLRGRKCSARWVSRRMTQLVRESYNDSNLFDKAKQFVASPHWRRRFYSRYKLVTRRKTNKRHLSMDVRINKWKDYHSKLRHFIQAGDQIDPKYGSFIPENRYYVDQVSCPFGLSDDKTIEEKGTKTVQIRGCSTVDTEKRMCTLQVLIRARGVQPKLAIIFRGKGRYLSQERPYYDNRVDVYAQNKAWVD